MVVALAALASSGSNSPLALVAFFAAGAFLFYLGFRTFREYRLLADTPLIPVRSMPMGLVHVHGKATGDDRLTSPLTKQSCYYFRLEVERYEQAGKNSGWKKVRSDQDQRKFYLDDGTGKVLVDPQSAEFDVLQTFQGEYGSHSKRRRVVDPSLGMAAMSEGELQAFVQQYSSRGRSDAMAKMNNAQAAAPRGKSHGFHISVSGGGGFFEFGTDQSYRVTERCLLAGRECNILGTCAENPESSDDQDRNLLHRGENEKTFLITTNTEKQEEKNLRKRSAILVLIGSVMMVMAAAFAIYGGNKQPAQAAPPGKSTGQVTAVSLSADPAQYTGPCPGKITFTGTITTDGPAKVFYRFPSSMKLANGQPKVWMGGALNFAAAGTQTVTKLITFVGDGSHISATLDLATNHPNNAHSEDVPFTVDCAGQ